jgi:SAM-dependent methyltransferase
MTLFRDTYLKKKNDYHLCIYDLGSCDVNGSYRHIFDISPWKYVGVDLSPGQNVDIVLRDPYRWYGIKTNSVDVLISGQAFEHIEYFWVTILEISRVLKPGGLCCIIAPSGGTEHRFPVDCWRFFPDGFTALARFGRLVILEIYTQWKPESRYTDMSNIWRDSVLICRKPHRNKFRSLLFRLWCMVMHKILLLGLPRKT